MSIGGLNPATAHAAFPGDRGVPIWHVNYNKERAALTHVTAAVDSVSLVRRHSGEVLPVKSQWADLMLEKRQLGIKKRELSQELDWLKKRQKQCEAELGQTNADFQQVKKQLKAMNQDLDSHVQTWQAKQWHAKRQAAVKAYWKQVQQRGNEDAKPVPPQTLLEELRRTRANIQETSDSMQRNLEEAKRFYREVKSHLWKGFWYELKTNRTFDKRFQVLYRDEHGREQEVSFNIKQVERLKKRLVKDIRADEQELRAFQADMPHRFQVLDLQIQELERMVAYPVEVTEPAGIVSDQPQPEAQFVDASGLESQANVQPKVCSRRKPLATCSQA